MRPLSAQLLPARHRLGPTAWSLLEPSQRSHLFSFMNVQAVHQFCTKVQVMHVKHSGLRGDPEAAGYKAGNPL
jgi:hypothetical protein